MTDAELNYVMKFYPASKPEIASYGFSADVNEKIRRNLPDGHNLYLCDSYTDLMTTPSDCFFADAEKMSDEELKDIMELCIMTEKVLSHGFPHDFNEKLRTDINYTPPASIRS
jgi:hypothetical protein